MYKKRIMHVLLLSAMLVATSCATRTITSTPNGARVFNEAGAYLGDTPHKMTDPVGFPMQCFYLKKKGFHDSGKRCLEEKISGPQTLLVEMKPVIRVPASIAELKGSRAQTITESAFGYVKLSANVDDVRIFINSKNAGIIKDADSLFNKKLPIGIHDITARKSFYMPLSVRITLAENDVLEYRINLFRVKDMNKIPPHQPTPNIQILMGTLTILTERPDLIVLVEGEKMRPPFKLKDIPAGEYRLRIKGGRGLNEMLNITVQDRQDTVLDLDRHFNLDNNSD